MVDALKAEGPFTVFAPTDAAFGSANDVEELRALPASTIGQVLTYHVVPGMILSSDLSNGQVVETLEGSSFTVTIDEGDGEVSINDADVVQVDIMATNGVIHVIDEVIFPPGVEEP